MSVWDFDEYGNPYPSEERPDYDDNLYDDSNNYNNAAHNHHRHLDEEEEHHHHHLIHHDNQDEAFLFSTDNGEPSHSHHSGSHAAHAAHHDHHHDGHHHSSPAAHHVHSHYEQQQPSQQLHHEDYQLHEHHMYEDHGNSSQNFDTVGNANDSTQHTSSPQQQQQQQQQHSRNDNLFSSSRVVQLNLDEIDTLATSHRSKPWLVVLYAPWCTYCQAMEPAFNMVAQRLQHSDVFVAKFQADGDNKPYAKQYLQLESFPTILFFPANSSSVVKYQSEDREANALLGFVHSFNRLFQFLTKGKSALVLQGPHRGHYGYKLSTPKGLLESIHRATGLGISTSDPRRSQDRPFFYTSDIADDKGSCS